ncbi:hypothetical protein ACQJBY_027669 [Aegilops geniculata]
MNDSAASGPCRDRAQAAALLRELQVGAPVHGTVFRRFTSWFVHGLADRLARAHPPALGTASMAFCVPRSSCLHGARGEVLVVAGELCPPLNFTCSAARARHGVPALRVVLCAGPGRPAGPGAPADVGYRQHGVLRPAVVVPRRGVWRGARRGVRAVPAPQFHLLRRAAPQSLLLRRAAPQYLLLRRATPDLLLLRPRLTFSCSAAARKEAERLDKTQWVWTAGGIQMSTGFVLQT